MIFRLNGGDSMKLLVTGGAGFIGSCFIKYIFNMHPDWEVINLDALEYAGNPENLREVEGNSNYRFVHGNICNRVLVNDLMKECDCVVNFAAQTHVDRSIISPDAFIETNIKGTFNLLDAALKAGGKRFVQISTDEVYGSILDGCFTETTPISPNSPYSASKASADILALSYYTTYGLPVTVTRCSNNYGPNQYPEKLIPFFITRLLNDKTIPLYGDGLNVRDWLYVYDHCSAIEKVILSGRVGEIYNIGGHCEKTNLEIAKIILDYFGYDESRIEYVEDRLGHDRRYAVDNTKICSELGWVPLKKFDEGIKSTIDWYINNKDWIINAGKRALMLAV